MDNFEVKCVTCDRLGLTPERIDSGGTSTTLMGPIPFWDKDRKQHTHDGNRNTTGLLCSNGHKTVVYWYKECWCGWRRTNNAYAEHPDAVVASKPLYQKDLSPK